MRTPLRVPAALTTAGLAGTSVLVLGLAGTAAAEDSRYSLFAQGDSMFFQVDGEDIPFSPKNAAGSLTSEAQTDSTGQTSSFAGAPYFGKTAQTAPGTVNGVPNQFGAGQLQLPLSQFPGYITASYPSQPKTDDSNYYYKVHAEAGPDGAKAAGSNGAPEAVPAPNQQQSVAAEVNKLANGSTVTNAEGSAAGFVQGPLEVGYSMAKATITDTGADPKISSAAVGRFSVGGQDFGYNKSGFTYLGQSTDKKTAFESANDALKAAGIELDIAPETTKTDPTSGITTYVLGGLKVTSTFTDPNGAKYTVGYILGRVEVASVNAPVSAVAASNVSKSAVTLGAVSAAHQHAGTRPNTSIAKTKVTAPRATYLSSDVPTRLTELQLTAIGNRSATSDQGPYTILVLAGIGILMVQPLFSVLATRRVIRRKR
jgi:hypothetical protein